MTVLWIAIVSMGVIALVAAFMKRGRQKGATASPAEVAAQLRESVFVSDPVALGIGVKSGEAWGVIMDTGHPKAVVTVVSLADGSASIYFSSGGGYIGGGGQPAVREAAAAFVRSATAVRGKLEPATEHPLPAAGQTRFYVLTPEGLRTAQALEKDLGENRHELSPLFYAGQEVITQFRLTSGPKGDQ
jgi:hypothetical protein